MSPTQRALAHCKRMGWTAQVVEKWIPQAKRRIDLFGIIDIVVLDRQAGGPLGLQVTSGSPTGNHALRVHKAIAEPKLVDWLLAPARFEVWSFSKKGKAGKRKVWTLRTEPITFDNHELHLAVRARLLPVNAPAPAPSTA